jgi:general secretion pathway protein C
VVAGQLALLVWKLLPQNPHAAPPAPALAETAATPGLASQVFGTPPPPETAAATQVSAIALTLVGTLAAKDPTAGLAIVGPTVNDAHVYATQTDIAPGVRLLEVYTDHILIDRGGAKETINLPRTGGGIGMPVAARPIADVARQAAAAPEVIGDLMRPMPNYVAGQLRGFKLFPGRDLKRFRALGLEPGDLITQVNNVPIGDAQHGLEMLQALGTATSASVMVERGGVIQSITIDSSQLQLSSDPRHSGTGTPAPAAESNSNE